MSVFLLLATSTKASYEEEGREFGNQLFEKGYADKTSELNEIKQSFIKEPHNKHLESHTQELSSTFEANFDQGKKGEDPLKNYFAHKNLEASKNKHPNQPSLGDAEVLLKQKHRFKIANDDLIFKKHQEVTHQTDDTDSKEFSKGQPSENLHQTLKDKIVTCRISAVGKAKSCIKRRIVRLVDGPLSTKSISVSASGAAYYNVLLTVNLMTGAFSFSTDLRWGNDGMKEPYGKAEVSSSFMVAPKPDAQISFVGISNKNEPRATYTVLQHPSNSNGYIAKISFHFNSFWEAESTILHPMSATYTWTLSEPTKELQETWGGCEELERQVNEGFCELIHEEKQELNETRMFSGCSTPITREHWRENKKFICGAGRDIDECETLIQQKCEQIDSKCAEFKNGVCIEYENTFKCKTPEYLKGEGLAFNPGDLSFLKGKEQPQTSGYSANDFGEAITHFKALTEMGQKMQDELGGVLGDPNNPSVFHGKCRQCRITLGSVFRDCCKLKGLLQGLIGQCNQEEKQLAIAAVKNKRCVKVGRYCHKKKAGICLEKRDSYCCYGSQLSRIIQEIAHQQLNISWGDGKNPNCGSLTSFQLSQLNFDTPYAQAKLGEILAEVQATAQEKFNQVNQQIASSEEIRNKIGSLQKNLQTRFTDIPIASGKTLRAANHEPLSPRAKEALGEKALTAAQSGDFQQVEALVNSGVDPSFYSNSSQTPLHFASCHYHKKEGSRESVETLLNEGANPHKGDGSGWTPIDYAIYSENKEALAVYIERGLLTENNFKFAKAHRKEDFVYSSEIQKAITSGNLSKVNDLLKRSISPNVQYNQQTPLHFASLSSTPHSIDIIKALLNAGAHIKSADGAGWTPVHYAIHTNNIEAVRFYIEKHFVETQHLKFAEAQEKSELIPLLEQALRGGQ